MRAARSITATLRLHYPSVMGLTPGNFFHWKNLCESEFAAKNHGCTVFGWLSLRTQKIENWNSMKSQQISLKTNTLFWNLKCFNDDCTRKYIDKKIQNLRSFVKKKKYFPHSSRNRSRRLKRRVLESHLLFKLIFFKDWKNLWRLPCWICTGTASTGPRSSTSRQLSIYHI